MTNSPMSNINKQALREAAIEAKSTNDWGCDAENFHDKATPNVVLALLDELEAAEKRVAEQREEIARLETMADNAHEALSAVLESGEVMNLHVINMLRRGLNNQPVHAAASINGEG
ncbi:ead/Ea22-like family protein [Escherichia coli]|nr:ead/Ea22-like family protein [Escherichia coli]